MPPIALALASLVATATTAFADGFSPVTDRDSFVALVTAKELRYPVFSIRLIVSPDGQITGSALGAPITGTWSWKDGYFCREMQWGGTPIPFNCQLVEATGDERLRFTVDKGAGDSATFRLQ